MLDKEVERRKRSSVEGDKIPGSEHSTCYTYLCDRGLTLVLVEDMVTCRWSAGSGNTLLEMGDIPNAN